MSTGVSRAQPQALTIFSIALVAALMVLGGGEFANAADVKITKPENDQLVMTPTTTIEGTGAPEGGAVSVRLNGSAFATSVSGGKWSVTGIPLNVGANSIDVQIGEKRDSVLTVRGSDNITARPQQKVFFLWNPGVDDELKRLAKESSSATLSDAELATFATNVRKRTVEVFQQRYANVADVKVVGSDGDDVHIVSMLRVNDSVFGSSPFDCGSKTPKQISEIHVGTYRSQMTMASDSTGFIAGWGPMKRSDSIDIRTEDVAQALGRTSAHEFGHSLGLTGGPTDNACQWMDGCDAGHNCDAFDASHPRAKRFDGGWHIMDPGGKTVNNARISEPNPLQRTNPRKSPVFESFGASYLRLVHPPL
jgi:hypothetical protein